MLDSFNPPQKPWVQVTKLSTTFGMFLWAPFTHLDRRLAFITKLPRNSRCSQTVRANNNQNPRTHLNSQKWCQIPSRQFGRPTLSHEERHSKNRWRYICNLGLRKTPQTDKRVTTTACNRKSKTKKDKNLHLLQRDRRGKRSKRRATLLALSQKVLHTSGAGCWLSACRFASSRNWSTDSFLMGAGTWSGLPSTMDLCSVSQYRATRSFRLSELWLLKVTKWHLVKGAVNIPGLSQWEGELGN